MTEKPSFLFAEEWVTTFIVLYKISDTGEVGWNEINAISSDYFFVVIQKHMIDFALVFDSPAEQHGLQRAP